MKKFILLQTLIVLCAISTLAQIKILDNKGNGGVLLGNHAGATEMDSMITVQVLGPYDVRAGSKLALGDFGHHAAWNVFAGEWGTTDTDQLWLHGKYGTYLTRGDNAEWLSIVAYYNSKEGNKFNFNCPIYSQGVLLTSDERLKSNVNNIESPLSQLLQLEGVSFNYDYDNLLKLNNVQSVEDHVSSQNIETSNLTEKEQAAMIERERIMEMMRVEAEKKKLGFLAQEVQKVFPELVAQDSAGYYYVDYIGLIPVIVEAIKEQQTGINDLKQKVLALTKENNLPHIRSAASPSDGSTALQTPAVAGCRLEQNTPNPFNQSTQIKYYLPETVISAYLCIYGMQGKQLQQIALTQRGEGAELISASQLDPGMYLYALIADGQEVDVKRMILTE